MPVDALGWTDADGTAHDGQRVPPRVVTTGLPYLVVPFRDRTVLAGVTSDRNAAASTVARRQGCDSVALVAPGNAGAIADADVHVRVLVDPAVGIREDPATGSAAGPVAVYLGVLGGAQDEVRHLVIEQGVGDRPAVPPGRAGGLLLGRPAPQRAPDGAHRPRPLGLAGSALTGTRPH